MRTRTCSRRRSDSYQSTRAAAEISQTIKTSIMLKLWSARLIRHPFSPLHGLLPTCITSSLSYGLWWVCILVICGWAWGESPCSDDTNAYSEVNLASYMFQSVSVIDAVMTHPGYWIAISMAWVLLVLADQWTSDEARQDARREGRGYSSFYA